MVDVTVFGAHPPAGAHNGHRRRRVKDLLLRGYARVMATLRRRARRQRNRRGRNVVELIDANWRTYPPLLRRMVTAIKRPPDFIRAKAAKGRRVKVHQRGFVPMYVEPKMHGLLWARVSFPPKKEKR
ncbi:hypothetical protein [Nocardioides sp.]|uniref:hypothetical protein n=1 Tax=Nocardioides sp. TaxID=35761 RepID=UPI003565845A